MMNLNANGNLTREGNYIRDLAKLTQIEGKSPNLSILVQLIKIENKGNKLIVNTERREMKILCGTYYRVGLKPSVRNKQATTQLAGYTRHWGNQIQILIIG